MLLLLDESCNGHKLRSLVSSVIKCLIEKKVMCSYDLHLSMHARAHTSLL